MTGGSFQTVSSWPAGAAALACGTGFALLTGDAGGAWRPGHADRAHRTLLSGQAIATICALGAHRAGVAGGAFRTREADSAGTTGFAFSAVFSIATFRAAAAARASKAFRADGTIFAWQALLAGQAWQALIALRASGACSAVEAGGAVAAGESSVACSAWRPGGQPIADLILNV